MEQYNWKENKNYWNLLQKVPGKIQEGKTKMQTKIKKDYEKPNWRKKAKKENYYQDPNYYQDQI